MFAVAEQGFPLSQIGAVFTRLPEVTNKTNPAL
jgi:hypothetical protein